jgi:Predicted glutamine amidotransferase involved in pyridoxine biosynthesis
MGGVVGVLALQGDFREHKEALRRLGVEAKEVRKPEHLLGLKALIVPGGESTTIGKLAREYGLEEAVRRRVEEGSLALFGTCAGAIWMAKEILGYPEQPHLGVLDVALELNPFGRQVDSFDEMVEVNNLGAFSGVFIPAPLFMRLEEGCGAKGQQKARNRKKAALLAFFHRLRPPDEHHKNRRSSQRWRNPTGL